MNLFIKRPFYISLLCSLALLAVFGTAHAQYNELLKTDVGVQINPENPGPNEQVSVTLSSFATDLNSATVTWQVGGKTIKSGKGSKTFSFSTGGLNSTTNLRIVIRTAEGETIEKTYSIKPTNVDLVWQVFGYTPPFYKGKALFSHQDKIQFVAIPHVIGSNGKEINPKNLIYTWTRNGTVIGDFSGYGKDTYTVAASVISRPLTVSVEVTSPDVDGVGTAVVTANPVEPTVLLYEKNPLYGIQFQKALVGDIDMGSSKEINILSMPYFFGVSYPTHPELTYSWSINSTQVDGGLNATSKVFRPLEGTSGASSIAVSIEDSAKILQFSSTSFNLSFDVPKSDAVTQ